MCRGAFAGQKTGLVQQERARANGRDVLRALAGAPDVVDQIRVVDFGLGALPARDEHQIRLRGIRKCVVSLDVEAVGAPHHPLLRHSVRVPLFVDVFRRGGEHFVRTDEVQLLEVWEQYERDIERQSTTPPSRRHGSTGSKDHVGPVASYHDSCALT